MGGTPPAFNPPGQQTSNRIWLWLLLAVAAFCVICGFAGFFMVKNLMGTGFSMVSCAMNGSLAQNALLAYAMEHDGRFPEAATWQDDIRPYYEQLYNKAVEEMSLKDMPDWVNISAAAPGTVLECDLGGGKKTGFAYNDLVAGKLKSEFTDPRTTILVYETTTPSYNAHGDPNSRPDDPSLKVFGEKRDWFDFMIEGQSDMFESGDSDFDFDIRPEDAIPSKDGATTGTANPAGA